MIKLKKLLSTIFFFPILILVGIFTASNTGHVDIFFWPFGKVVNIPIWIAIIFSLFLGLFVGSMITSFSFFFNKLNKKHSKNNV